MLKTKYHIIIIALLFSGAMSFSQERFNLTITDTSGVEGAFTIKSIAAGYEICSFYSFQGRNKFKRNIIDFSGNLHQTDTLATYEGILARPFKMYNSYILIGSKDSLIPSTPALKPYIVKVNSDLDTAWTLHLRNYPFYAQAYSAIETFDHHILVSGHYEKTIGQWDYFALKLDTLGNIVWYDDFNTGNGNSRLLSTTKTYDGGFILSGYTNSYGNGAIGGDYDIYAVKIDSSGTIQWQNTWGGIGGEGGFVSSYTDSTIMIYGGIDDPVYLEYDQYFAEVMIDDGTTKWDTTFALSLDETEECFSFEVLPNGSFVAAGFYMDDDIQNPAGFLMKFNANKQVEWIRKYKIRTNDHYFRDLIQTNDGGFAMTGFVFPDGTGNTQDTWVVKVDSMGCDVPLCYLGDRELGLELPILKCYPNPTSYISTIELLENSREIQLYNSAGILLKKYEVSNGQKNYKLDLSLMPHDIYILRLLDKNGITIGQGKVVKQ